MVYEETYYARDSGTLEQLKELSTKRQALEESINGSSRITPAIAREMAGGITSPILQVIFSCLTGSSFMSSLTILDIFGTYLNMNVFGVVGSAEFVRF